MLDWNFSDLVITILLMISVPPVVTRYLRAPVYSRAFRRNVMIVGVVWLAYAWISENYVYYLIGLSRADAGVHWCRAMEMSEDLSKGLWPFGNSFPLSNQAYDAYLAWLNYLTDARQHRL